jgi:hypothetical protein
MERGILEPIELFADVQGNRERIIALNVGLLVFFPIPFRLHAQAVENALSAYFNHVPWETFRFQNLTGTSRGYKKITASARATVSDWLNGKREYGKACSIWLKDGQSATDAGDNLLRLFGKDEPDSGNDSNYLLILFPADILDRTPPDAFADRVNEVVSAIPFHSAYVGYMLGTSTLLQVSPYSDLMDERLYAIGKRFLGIEITRPHLENYEMAAHVRSASWITYLSHTFVNLLGGEQTFRSLKANFKIRQTKTGIGIQAGDMPQLGDKNRRREVAPEQRVLAGTLQSLYSNQPAFLFSTKAHDATIDWFRRLIP